MYLLALVAVLALPTSCQKDLPEDPSDTDSVELEARDSCRTKTRGQFVEPVKRMKSYRDYYAIANDVTGDYVKNKSKPSKENVGRMNYVGATQSKVRGAYVDDGYGGFYTAKISEKTQVIALACASESGYDPCAGLPCTVGSVCWPGCSYEETKCKGRASADLATCQGRARYRAFRIVVVGGGLAIAGAAASKGKGSKTTSTIAFGTLGLSTWGYVVDLQECREDYARTVTRCQEDN